jgi:hypothetical protein
LRDVRQLLSVEVACFLNGARHCVPNLKLCLSKVEELHRVVKTMPASHAKSEHFGNLFQIAQTGVTQTIDKMTGTVRTIIEENLDAVERALNEDAG